MTSHHHTTTPENRHTVTPKADRGKKKHGFVIYQDQLRALKGMKMRQWQKTGIEPEIGEFVREAIDDFLEKNSAV